MDTLGTILRVLGGILIVAGMFISLRGYRRSTGGEKMDFRSYFVGVTLIGIGVGLLALADEL